MVTLPEEDFLIEQTEPTDEDEPQNFYPIRHHVVPNGFHSESDV